MIPSHPGPHRTPWGERWIERFPLAERRPILGLAVTLALAGLAWLARDLADPLLPPGFPYVTFFPAVIVTSFLLGVRLGAVSAAVCGLLAWYFFIPPAGGFTLTPGAGFALSLYVLVVGTDLALVHWMQRANRQLARERQVSRSLAETRELLFRELQHRVSNNLQVAAALLSAQKRQLTDATARQALDDTAQRLTLIGSISRQLYDPTGAATPLRAFLADLCRSVVEASGRGDIALAVTGDETLRLPPDAAVPAALIVAEAVSNAIEHGFAGGRGGSIAVIVAGDEGEARIAIRDDGHGLPAGFDAEGATSLGLRIATMLARGRGGAFTLAEDRGTVATLTLPATA